MKIGVRRFGASLLAVFGLLSLVCSTTSQFLPSAFPHGWLALLGLLALSVVAALVMCRPRHSVTVRLSSPDTAIEIRVGDLFAEPGHIVVGTNDCFDTELGDVISQKSVQGQFLQQRYRSDVGQLDRDIEAALAEYADRRTEDTEKHRGKRWRYPIGTVIALGAGSCRCFLPAYTRMGNDLVCQSNADWIWRTLSALWCEVRGKGECGEVSIPIIGSELARTGLPRQTLVQLIVISFLVASKRDVVSRKLNVVVHPSDLKHINMGSLQQFLTNACF